MFISNLQKQKKKKSTWNKKKILLHKFSNSRMTKQFLSERSGDWSHRWKSLCLKPQSWSNPKVISLRYKLFTLSKMQFNHFVKVPNFTLSKLLITLWRSKVNLLLKLSMVFFTYWIKLEMHVVKVIVLKSIVNVTLSKVYFLFILIRFVIFLTKRLKYCHFCLRDWSNGYFWWSD